MSTATPKWQPHLLPPNSAPPDRRHSSATLSKPRQSSTSSSTGSPSSSPLASRRGSAASGPLTATSAINNNNARKYSDGSKPAWMTSIQARDGDTSASPSRRSSLSGLFGRRKSEDTSSTSKKQPQVITSKHSVSIKNVLKVDPRGARKHPSAPAKLGEGAMNEGLQHYSHMTAQAQEMRHPHSGPPTLRGDSGLMLTRIVSMGEEPEEDEDQKKEVSTLEQVREHPGRESVGGGEDERPTTNGKAATSPTTHPAAPTTPTRNTDQKNAVDEDFDLSPEQRRHSHHNHETSRITEETEGADTERPRRKSLMDVEIKGAEEGERTERRRERRNSKVKLVFGGWHKDDRGNWTRK